MGKTIRNGFSRDNMCSRNVKRLIGDKLARPKELHKRLGHDHNGGEFWIYQQVFKELINRGVWVDDALVHVNRKFKVSHYNQKFLYIQNTLNVTVNKLCQISVDDSGIGGVEEPLNSEKEIFLEILTNWGWSGLEKMYIGVDGTLWNRYDKMIWEGFIKLDKYDTKFTEFPADSKFIPMFRFIFDDWINLGMPNSLEYMIRKWRLGYERCSISRIGDKADFN